MPTQEPWTTWGWSGLTMEIWVLLSEKEQINAAKPTVVPRAQRLRWLLTISAEATG